MGFDAMIQQQNLIKKLVGLGISQTSIIVFFLLLGRRSGGVLPILQETGNHEYLADPSLYVNPLPQVLMLTAIVVGVATLGVALAVCQQLYDLYGTLEEDKILQRQSESQEEPGWL